MPLSDPYATLDECLLGAKNSATPTDEEEDLWENNILTISRWIEQRTGWAETGFNKDSSAVARVLRTPADFTGGKRPDAWPYVENPFVGMSQNPTFEVPAMSTVPTTVKVDYRREGTFTNALSLTNNVDYYLRPRNANLRPLPGPFYAIELTGRGTAGMGNSWPAGMLVEITVPWGWPAVPTAIKDLVIEYVRIFYVKGPRANYRLSDMDGLVETSKECLEILQKVMRQLRRPGSQFG